MDLRLHIVTGPDEGQYFTVAHGSIRLIGRSHQFADICLHDLTVSRRHCEIESADETIKLTDVDSDTGTFVNGERVSQCQIRVGDVIKIGNTEMRVQAMDAETTPAPQAASLHDTAKVVSPPAPTTAPGAEMAERLAAELAQSVFGRFQVGAVLGIGLHGLVLRARDGHGGRDVALKVFHSDFPRDDAERQRFIEASRAGMAVRHPNLVTLHGAGRTAEYCWQSLDLVKGPSAADLIEQHRESSRPDWQVAYGMAVHVARALNAVAEAKMVHSQVTPRNIVISGAEGTARLNDLTQAQALADSALWNITLRQRLRRDLPYYAPERTFGGAAASEQSDLYSLGAVIYAVLTGQPPFVGQTPAQTIQRIRESTPTAAIRSRPEIPKAFDKIIIKLLAKQPAKRFASAQDLMHALADVGVARKPQEQ